MRPSRLTSRALLSGSGAALVLLLCCLVPAVGSRPHTNPNELIRIEHAVAMARWTTHDLSEVALAYGMSEDVAVREGRPLSDKAPGLSLLAVPLVWVADAVLPHDAHGLPEYWPLRHLLTVLLASLPAVVAAWAVGRAAPRGEPDTERHATCELAVALGLATPLVTYGTVLLGHALSAGLVALAWMPVLARWRARETLEASIAWWSGIAAGFAVSTEYPVVLLATVLGTAVVLDRASPFRARAAFAGGAAVGVLPMALVNQFAFGAPWRTGYSFKAAPDFREIIQHGFFGIATPTLKGLSGVLLGTQRGLLWYSPALVLAIVGLVYQLNRRTRSTLTLLAGIAVYITFAAAFGDWRAGWCAAARHLTPVVPLLMLATVDGIRALSRSAAGTAVATMLATVAVTHTLLTVVVTPFFPVEFDAPLTQLVVPSIAEGHVAPTVIGVLTGLSDLVVWCIVGVISLVVVTVALVRFSGRRTVTVSVAATTLAVHVLLLAAGAAARPPELEPFRQGLVRYLGLDGTDAD